MGALKERLAGADLFVNTTSLGMDDSDAIAIDFTAMRSGALVTDIVYVPLITPIPAQAPKLNDIKLINFDFAKYGSSAERKRLLSKWDNEVKNLPK